MDSQKELILLLENLGYWVRTKLNLEQEIINYIRGRVSEHENKLLLLLFFVTSLIFSLNILVVLIIIMLFKSFSHIF